MQAHIHFLLKSLVIATAIIFSFQKFFPHQSEDICNESRVETIRVKGNSLTGLIEDQESLQFINGAYKCQTPERNDIVVFTSPYHSIPLIKKIYAVPGDLIEFKEQRGRIHLFINDTELTNSKGEAFSFPSFLSKSLKHELEKYSGEVPFEHYLLLGNQFQGTWDSSRLGFVKKSQLLGKAKKSTMSFSEPMVGHEKSF